MEIIIHRGQNQIGGSIIEVRSHSTRLILDVGSELDEDVPAIPQIEGLFQGELRYDAVLISHYHGDHIGLSDRLPKSLPIYMGEKAAAIHRTACELRGVQAVVPAGFLRSGESFCIGDITVTPYLCDHSAFDAYMLLLELDGKRVLYTGDFRDNGRKNFSSLLKRLEPVDVLISEGTTLSRGAMESRTEAELEMEAAAILSETEGPAFIFQASTNIDRIVTAYKAAKRGGRVFLQDLYTASVTDVIGGSIPNPKTFSDVRVFMPNPSDKNYARLNSFGRAKIGRSAIAKQRFLMCVRPSMRFYLEKLSQEMSFENGVLFYSMWEGYRDKEDIAAFLDFMEKKGVRLHTLHTSGHADTNAFEQLIVRTKPDYLIPVHTENAAWFERVPNCSVIYDKTFSLI